MGRRACCAKEGLNRGAWAAHEDKVLTEYIKVHGEGKWRDLPKRAGLKRCGKSCRLRWLNYLRPDIKRGNISPDEEELIVRLHKLLGNRWSLIAGRLPGRTDNEIKNYWNTILSKKNQVQEASAGSARASLTSADGELPKHKEAKNAMSSPSSLSHNVVIRTKATKCSKVFIDPPLPHNDHHKPVDHQLHKVNYQPSTGNNGLSSSAYSLENSLAFMVDFDTSDELSLPNLLGMDFSCRDPLFSEEMLLQQQYWSGSVGGVEDSVVDHQLQPNMVLNFQSLNIFLEGDADQGEWHALGKST